MGFTVSCNRCGNFRELNDGFRHVEDVEHLFVATAEDIEISTDRYGDYNQFKCLNCGQEIWEG